MERERDSAYTDYSGDEITGEQERVLREGLNHLAHLMRSAMMEDLLVEQRWEQPEADADQRRAIAEERAVYVAGPARGLRNAILSDAGSRWVQRLLAGERVGLDEWRGPYTVEWVLNGAAAMPAFRVSDPERVVKAS